MYMNALQRTELFGWEWVAESKRRLLNYLEQHLDNSQDNLLAISTGNPEQVMLAQQDDHFFQIVRDAFDLVLPDGEGIVLASGLLNNQTKNTKIKERLAGVEIVAELISHSNPKHGSILVIGGREYQDSKIKVNSTDYIFRAVLDSSQSVQTSINNQELLWLPAYEDAKQPSVREEALVERTIKRLRPSLVFVALGAPQQEFWVAAHKQLLTESGTRIVMVVGGAFDMLTGKVLRAPKFLRQLKLEWFWRLLQEPSRWRRQLVLIKFITYVFKLKFL